jgi:hypothetical protein
MKTPRLRLDFAPGARHVSSLGLAMLVVSAVLLGAVAFQFGEMLAGNARQADTLAALEARRGVVAAGATRPTAPEPAVLARVRAVRQVAQTLTTPWADLLESLESAPNQSVGAQYSGHARVPERTAARRPAVQRRARCARSAGQVTGLAAALPDPGRVGNEAMNRLLQCTWRRAVRRVGYPGLLALALLLPAAVIALWIPQASRRADDLRTALVAQADAIARHGQPVQRPPSSGEQAAQFVAGFPALAQSSTDLGEVFASTSLITYSVTFPVRNEYAALKGFTADVLEALPHASMDELRLSRTDAGTGVLDGVVRFTFIYRSL